MVMTPRRLMRLVHEGLAIPEALKMDRLDVMDREMVSRRRRSVLTMLHLVLHLASLAQLRMNSFQGRTIPGGLSWCKRCWKA
jgi:hypothetical protein